MKDLIALGLFTYWDAFMWGVFVGGLLVVVARFLETYLHNTIAIHQKQLDIKLAEALKKMREELDQ